MHPSGTVTAGILFRIQLAVSGCIFLLAAGPALSSPRYFMDLTAQPAPWHYAASSGISLDEAVSRVRRQTSGKILSAETVRIDGRPVHLIKVLTQDGRVKRIRIDAGGSRGKGRGG